MVALMKASVKFLNNQRDKASIKNCEDLSPFFRFLSNKIGFLNAENTYIS